MDGGYLKETEVKRGWMERRGSSSAQVTPWRQMSQQSRPEMCRKCKCKNVQQMGARYIQLKKGKERNKINCSR
jgi:hypothetical protein